jgi:hypothetical protein
MRDLELLGELRQRVLREARTLHDYIQLEFHDCAILNLNNEVSLDGRPVPFSGEGEELLRPLSGSTVVEVTRTSEYFALGFSGGRVLSMNLRPEAWRSAEALSMYLPGEPIVVLNEP